MKKYNGKAVDRMIKRGNMGRKIKVVLSTIKSFLVAP